MAPPSVESNSNGCASIFLKPMVVSQRFALCKSVIKVHSHHRFGSILMQPHRVPSFILYVHSCYHNFLSCHFNFSLPFLSAIISKFSLLHILFYQLNMPRGTVTSVVKLSFISFTVANCSHYLFFPRMPQANLAISIHPGS